jgi:hypothetical protein
MRAFCAAKGQHAPKGCDQTATALQPSGIFTYKTTICCTECTGTNLAFQVIKDLWRLYGNKLRGLLTASTGCQLSTEVDAA